MARNLYFRLVQFCGGRSKSRTAGRPSVPLSTLLNFIDVIVKVDTRPSMKKIIFSKVLEQKRRAQTIKYICIAVVVFVVLATLWAM